MNMEEAYKVMFDYAHLDTVLVEIKHHVSIDMPFWRALEAHIQELEKYEHVSTDYFLIDGDWGNWDVGAHARFEEEYNEERQAKAATLRKAMNLQRAA